LGEWFYLADLRLLSTKIG